MPERDAFGREVGEDSLAGLGWRTSVEPTSEPVAARVPDQVPVVAGIPGPRRRRRFPIGRLIVLVVIGVAVFAGIGLFRLASDAFDDLERTVRGQIPSVAVPPPQGLEEGSLLETAALRDALGSLPAGDVTSLRVAPERIDAQVIADGRMQLVQVRWDGGVTTVETPVSGGGEPVKVDPAAPERIATTAARRARRDVTDVSYLVLSSFGGKSEWQLFFIDGLHYSASASGKKVRKVG